MAQDTLTEDTLTEDGRLISASPTTDQQKIILLSTANRALTRRQQELRDEVALMLTDLERFADQARHHIGVATEAVIRRRIARLRDVLAGAPPEPIDQLKDMPA